MDIRELNNYLQSLPEEIISDAADIVSETATEYYKSAFRKKAFDGNPWRQAKVPKRTGSLLIDSGALVNSIHPVIVNRERVVISAGNLKVDYAQAHNEGCQGAISVPAHSRKVKGRSVAVPEYTRNTKNGSVTVPAHTWNIKEGDVQVKAHTRQANIPQREFMGDSNELNDEVHKRIEGYIDSITN